MAYGFKGWLMAGAIAAAMGSSPAQSAPPHKDPGSALGSLVIDQRSRLEKELAERMMRRADIAFDKKARLEMEIDLRVIERALLTVIVESDPQTAEQANAWLRAKQFRDCLRAMDGGLGAVAAAPSDSQKDAMAQLHQLTFKVAALKAKDLDAFCRNVALVLANCINKSPVDSKSLTPMRPKPRTGPAQAGRAATVGELSDEVQRLAAVSAPLRRQLLALSSAAAAAAGSNDEKSKSLLDMLWQSVELARGLQSNTAVGADARAAIEEQLAEGIALYLDPRTRDAGTSRVESLGQYRRTLARIAKLGLSREQMEQFGPAFAWAQSHPQAGAKALSDIEQYIASRDRWDMMPRDPVVPAPLRKSLEEGRLQYGKQRAAFMSAVPRIGTNGNAAELEGPLDEMLRLQAITEDLAAMSGSLEALNAYKLRPVGGLEKKVVTAAIAALSPIQSANRNDGQKYLHSVHSLARLSQTLGARPLAELPPAIAKNWAGGSTAAFETHWRAVVAELGAGLIAGGLELDPARVSRLETALRLGDALRAASPLEDALASAPALARWADWGMDPASLQLIVSPYRQAVAGAVLGFVKDNPEPLDKWIRLSTRYDPLIALIMRDAQYAAECRMLPDGLAGDIGRLATPFDNAPFATERFAAYSVGAWSLLQRSGDSELADQLSAALAKRLSHDLGLGIVVAESKSAHK